MKYQIFGADSVSGRNRQLNVDADSEIEAISFAKASGIFPYKIIKSPEPRTVAEPKFATASQTRLTESQPSGEYVLVSVLGGAVFLMVIFIYWDTFNPKAESNSPSATKSPSTYRYNDSSLDKELKSLSSLDGYSDSEKEQIISAAKKLDAAVDALEKNRGY